MPEPRSIGPVNPSWSARSGDTVPMPTVRCFQIRLSVRRVSYSSTQPGKRSMKRSMKSRSEPSRARLRRWVSRSPRRGDAVCFGISSGRSRYTPPGR